MGFEVHDLPGLLYGNMYEPGSIKETYSKERVKNNLSKKNR